MPTPPVTWIMPVRNAERTLDAALESIASQDYARQELLVWDDGSTDGTHEILKRHIGKTLAGKVIGTERIGLGRALARLVGHASSELIARADADDINAPDRISRQVAFLLEHRKVGVLGTQMRNLGTGEVMTHHPTADADIRWALRFENPVNHPTVMLRRSAVLEVGNYRDMQPGQDYDLWVRMGLICRFANLPEALVQYRVHEDAVSAAQRGDDGESFYKMRDALVDRLLPGIEPHAAARLLNLIRQPDNLHVTEEDLRRFRQAAMLAAKACRYQPSYFLSTTRFQAQENNLRTRYLKNKPVIRACLPLLRSAKTLTGKLQHKKRAQPGSSTGRAA
ncbi:MAG: glycosyltransferase [Phycisphaerales bacterium JB063]